MSAFSLNGVTYSLVNWSVLNNHACNNLQEVQYLGRATGAYMPDSFATPINNLMSALSDDRISISEREDTAFELERYLEAAVDAAEGYRRYVGSLMSDCNGIGQNCGGCNVSNSQARDKRNTAIELRDNLKYRRNAIVAIREALTAHQNDQISDEQLENEINFQRAVLRQRISETESSELDVQLKELGQKAMLYFIPVLLVVLFYLLYKSLK